MRSPVLSLSLLRLVLGVTCSCGICFITCYNINKGDIKSPRRNKNRRRKDKTSKSPRKEKGKTKIEESWFLGVLRGLFDYKSDKRSERISEKRSPRRKERTSPRRKDKDWVFV